MDPQSGIAYITHTLEGPPHVQRYPSSTWIANAAACLTGHYGDVTQQAQGVDCSRQTLYDHAQKVQAAVEAEHSGGPTAPNCS